MPSRSLTKPIDGSECRFIISAWISAFDIFDKLIRRSEIGVTRGCGFLAPLLPSLVLLVINNIIKIVRYVRCKEKERKDRESESEKDDRVSLRREN